MPQKGDPGFTFAGVLILATLGTFAWHGAPLESARPTSPSLTAPDVVFGGRIAARLWQDPLNVMRQIKQRADDEKAHGNVAHDLEKLSEVAHSGQMMVLSVMVTSGLYSELEERRRRRRYAVLAGLGDSGFAPRDAETLGILKVHLSNRSTDTQANTSWDSITIPYEWYDYEAPKPANPSGSSKRQFLPESVLVLWLDESRFADEPFARFRELVENIVHAFRKTNDDLRISWKVIGPSSSGTLRSFVKDFVNYADNNDNVITWLREESRLADFDILSPLATVSDSDLLNKPRPDRADESRSLFPGISNFCGVDGKTCLRFLRTIRSDDILIRELICELARRKLRQGDFVVVLSEWDTYFGRLLPRAFADAIEEATTNGKSLEGCVSDVPELKLLRYTYERGIDGITAGTTQVEQKIGKSNDTSVLDVLSPTEGVTVRRPEGNAQYDYIRRLADTILAQDRKLRLDSGRGVRAVAVLGSDVYDKLLILRALRHRLPGAIWVTTDLDAHFIHPGEFKWSRNLIVASTFGLSLPQDDLSSRSSPPFRDSYQTAVYLATRMALKPDFPHKKINPIKNSGAEPQLPPSYPSQQEMNNLLPPLLFEVGRHGFVRIGSPRYEVERDGNDKLSGITSSMAMAFPRAYLIGIGLISILGLFALHQLRSRSGRPVITIAVLIVSWIVLAMIAHWQARTGEPVSISDGISIWPTEFIRSTAIFLAATFCWITYNRLQANARMLSGRYFNGGSPQDDLGLTIRETVTVLIMSVRRVKFRAWLFGTLVLAVVIMFAMSKLRDLEYPLSSKLILLGVGWAVVIGLWQMFVNGKIIPSVAVLSINKWMTRKRRGREKTAAELWNSYLEYGALSHRVLRSFSYLLLYFVFGTIVFSLLGSVPPPCRGNACVVDGIVLGLSVVLMLFLLFFVVDATRLCICWIEKLQASGLSWDNTYRDELAKQLRLPTAHATYYLQIHLIGERTTEVSRLLYYPVVIILLMLLARSTYFDNWGFPQALAVIVTANFLIAAMAAARLNAVAKQARDKILDRLQRESLELQAEKVEQPVVATPDDIQELMGQLSRLRIGAFQPVWDQPLVRGAILVLGGIGVMYVEYLPWAL